MKNFLNIFFAPSISSFLIPSRFLPPFYFLSPCLFYYTFSFPIAPHSFIRLSCNYVPSISFSYFHLTFIFCIRPRIPNSSLQCFFYFFTKTDFRKCFQNSKCSEHQVSSISIYSTFSRLKAVSEIHETFIITDYLSLY